ncbi:hypothetical protein A1OE_704 [Candidatus Endolissoclinum faulkneri L2]|uniref:Uncharacterized protein n=1 Tax=Candidatus Endolissoclinum faulkneri L2 TaxID=1193729 RepID=K7YN15_9PROT|nr:hypothetical protein A1OE_704 [Candidatus Endolissoclinum faulkneri L2]
MTTQRILAEYSKTNNLPIVLLIFNLIKYYTACYYTSHYIGTI